MRPGERPAWVDVSAHVDRWDEWRARSSQRGLAVDVVLAVLLEYELVRRELDAAGLTLDVLQTTSNSEGTSRLAPTPDLRAWVSQLTANGESAPADELPEIALPQRLVHRAGPDVQTAAWDDLNRIEAAARCDAEAARHGMTLEAWVLRAALVENVRADGLAEA
jgi:hypothetical protein